MTLDLFIQNLQAFHFLRPWWLLTLPLIAFLWWHVRKKASRKTELPSVIAPHLAAALTVGQEHRNHLRPIDTVAIVLALLALATSGPSWSRVANPLVSDTAPLVVALKVTDTMMQPDVPPNRLERAKQKTLDLLAERSGAKTALIAYSGSAHQVVPLTEDPEVIKPFLEGLDPGVMPKEGSSASEALELALSLLEGQEEPGSILFLLDTLSDADQTLFADQNASLESSLHFWVFSRDANDIEQLKNTDAGPVVAVSIDRRDVDSVLKNIDAAYQAALSQDEQSKWRDRGTLFAWPAAIVLLFWFRRGWTMRWTAILLLSVLLQPPVEARADAATGRSPR